MTKTKPETATAPPAPEATAPEATAPEATAPEATAPEATAPEATAPEALPPSGPIEPTADAGADVPGPANALAGSLETVLTDIELNAVPGRLPNLIDRLQEAVPDAQVGEARGGGYIVRLHEVEAHAPDAASAFRLWCQRARRKIMKLREV